MISLNAWTMLLQFVPSNLVLNFCSSGIFSYVENALAMWSTTRKRGWLSRWPCLRVTAVLARPGILLLLNIWMSREGKQGIQSRKLISPTVVYSCFSLYYFRQKKSEWIPKVLLIELVFLLDGCIVNMWGRKLISNFKIEKWILPLGIICFRAQFHEAYVGTGIRN